MPRRHDRCRTSRMYLDHSARLMRSGQQVGTERKDTVGTSVRPRAHSREALAFFVLAPALSPLSMRAQRSRDGGMLHPGQWQSRVNAALGVDVRARTGGSKVRWGQRGAGTTPGHRHAEAGARAAGLATGHPAGDDRPVPVHRVWAMNLPQVRFWGGSASAARPGTAMRKRTRA